MVNYSAQTLDTTFAALSDPIRRAILSQLSQGEASVTELARPFSISLPAVLKHLHYLEKAGLVAGEKKGRIHKFQIVAAPMQSAAEWIAAYTGFWERQLDSSLQFQETHSKNESPVRERQSRKRRSK